MMIRNIHKAIIALLLIGLPSVSFAKRYDVTLPEVASCLKTAQPGDRIYIKDGQYKDMQLKWIGKGTEKSPITIEALNPGKVKVEGGYIKFLHTFLFDYLQSILLRYTHATAIRRITRST